MNPHACLPLLAALALVLAGGCGKNPVVAPATETKDADPITFREGSGLRLTPELLAQLGLKTAEAEERPLATTTTLTAQVFAVAPRVLANASVPSAAADALAKNTFAGATLVRVDPPAGAATGRVDFIFALERTPAPAAGEFVAIAATAPSRSAVTVPRAALLDSATGTFVYVVNAGAYLRTPVKTGARTADLIEITDGLYAGDSVAATAVEQLWLAELRLNQGGGHSH